jgi:pimeloyl-ACP methyl ester carboxylesterase
VNSEITRLIKFDVELNVGQRYLEAIWIGPGPTAAPTLIFLHEGLGCVDLWRDFPARLADVTGCGALVYSRLGYGGSDPCPLPRPVDFMHHEGLAVLPEVIRQTAIRDYLLVGHSDGGSIALIHSGGNPGPGLRGVISLAAHVFCEDLTRQSIEITRESYLNADLKARLSVYHGENTHCAFWGWNDVWLHPDFRHWTIETCLPAIRVPVLAIQGENDPYGTVAQLETIRAKTGSQVTVALVENCGHAPHLEKPVYIIEKASEFIQQCI